MMRAIRRASRFTAFLLSLVLANLTLVSSAYACTARGGAPNTGAMAGMIGMATAGSQSGSGSGLSASPSHAAQQGAQQSAQDGQQQQHSPCGLPWAPGACQSTALCAPVALISTAGQPAVSVRVPVSVADLTVALLPSEARAPEIPPPRA